MLKVDSTLLWVFLQGRDKVEGSSQTCQSRSGIVDKALSPKASPTETNLNVNKGEIKNLTWMIKILLGKNLLANPTQPNLNTWEKYCLASWAVSIPPWWWWFFCTYIRKRSILLLECFDIIIHKCGTQNHKHALICIAWYALQMIKMIIIV